MKNLIPEGTSGQWSVERFTVEKGDASGLFAYGPGRCVSPGTYTRLCRKGHVVMSDTPAEIRDLFPLRRKAKGRILMNGLGLGIAVELCFNKPAVEHITVIEKSRDVISLVGAHLVPVYGDRLIIIHADAFEYKPARAARYNVVWHDIWDDICADNLPEMHTLHRKYGRRADWQGSWCRYQCEEARKRERGFTLWM